MSSPDLALNRARAALQLSYIGDALAMPVHWFYNPMDILAAFPGGIRQFEPAPARHPSSIMALHSTRAGGRGSQAQEPDELVGRVILKGKRPFWGRPAMHYHQGMAAGDNTLNAHCARLLTRVLSAQGGRYDSAPFLAAYVDFMTAEPPAHPDTYAESYHRGFFANWLQGRPLDQCGAKTHDTASIGGFAGLGPLVISQLLHNPQVHVAQALCRRHLALTHPDQHLANLADAYVALVAELLYREDDSVEAIFARTAKASAGIDPEALTQKYPDLELIGGRFSRACYIDDAWPAVLCLAWKYRHHPWAGLLANTHVGGDNCHRGMVLGVLLGLASGQGLPERFQQLTAAQAIDQEISDLLAAYA